MHRLQPIGPDRLKLLKQPPCSLRRRSALSPNYQSLRAQTTEQLTTFHLEDMEVCSCRSARLLCERLAAGPLESSGNARLAFSSLPGGADSRGLANRR